MGNAILKCKIRNKNEYKDILIDHSDYERLSKYSWWENKSGYPVTNVKLGNGKWKNSVGMHRIVLNVTDNFHVDHINHNICDNRKENLRLCTNQQNIHNSKVRKDNKTGFKGVHFSNKDKRFVARINYNMKQITIGYFRNAEEAAKAYDKKAKDLFGEFAFLNFNLKESG